MSTRRGRSRPRWRWASTRRGAAPPEASGPTWPGWSTRSSTTCSSGSRRSGAAKLLRRGRLEREPTPLELAAAMDWTPERVEVVRDALQRARETSDSEIVAYLDDADDAGDTSDI